MRAHFTIAMTTAAFFILGNSSFAQSQQEMEKKIGQGVELIKLACGTGVSNDKLQLDGEANGSLTLKSLPSLSAGGAVTYSKQEAQGLIAALRDATGTEAFRLSEKQIDCMKPYIDRIFDVIFPQKVNQDKPPILSQRQHHFSVRFSPQQSYHMDGQARTTVDGAIAVAKELLNSQQAEIVIVQGYPADAPKFPKIDKMFVGEKRVDNVVRYLTKEGVPSQQIRVINPAVSAQPAVSRNEVDIDIR